MRPDSLLGTPLLRILRTPEEATSTFSGNDWSLLLRQAKRTNLLGRIAILCDSNQCMDRLPERVRLHFDNAEKLALASQRSALWEIKKIHQALAANSIPYVLLKGAAYLQVNAAPSIGRMFADTDIMVSLDKLAATESALIQHGWITTKLNAYDQKYYRTWMHELPPMQNLRRQTTIDVHHTIVPPTCKLKPEAALLWKNAQPIADLPGAHVLAPEDMILHSAVHLFHDGDFQQGLRDIVDIDALLRENATSAEFWDRLVLRATELDLCCPLLYAWHFCRELLATPVADDYLEAVMASVAFSKARLSVMDLLLNQALYPCVESNCGSRRTISKWLLYLRSHYLRMPLHLLIPHLLRKSLSSPN